MMFGFSNPTVTLKVRFNNFGMVYAGCLNDQLRYAVSKVYKVAYENYPSGTKKMFYVWSPFHNACVWVKAEDCEEVK